MCLRLFTSKSWLLLTLLFGFDRITADRHQSDNQNHHVKISNGDPRYQSDFSRHPDPQVRRAGVALRAAEEIIANAHAGNADAAARTAAEHLGMAEDAVAAFRQVQGSSSLTQEAGDSEVSNIDVAEGTSGSERSTKSRQRLRTSAGRLLIHNSLRADDDSASGPAKASVASSWWDPDPEDLAVVGSWANELAGGGEQGKAAEAEVREDPANAASVLQRLVGASRTASDGVDREKQTLSHLLELFFQSKGSQGHMKFTKDIVRDLAEDSRRLAELPRMSTLQLNEVAGPKLTPESDIGNIVQYFRGLERQRSKGNGTRALIFSCSYGDGHKSAAEAVTSYLETGGIKTTTVDTTADPRFENKGITPYSNYFYNSIVLKRQWYRLHNIVDSLKESLYGQMWSQCPAPTCNTPQKDRFRSVVLENRPDMLVTVYHMDLLPILEVAKDLGNIPVLHVGTDMDMKMHEVFGKAGPAPVYPRFLLGMPFNTSESIPTVEPVGVEKTFLSGYPIRSSFLETRNDKAVSDLKTKYAAKGTKVALVMTGGGGQDVPWPEHLANTGIGQPLHVIVVAGRNAPYVNKLSRALPSYVRLPDGRKVLQGQAQDVTVEVAVDPSNANSSEPFYVGAPFLSKLMDMADVVITKPGGGSTAEAAYRGAPALFDASPGLLHWEEFTVKVFEDAQRGRRFSDADELKSGIKWALATPRSTKLAEDPLKPGSLLDTGARLRSAAQSLLSTPCNRCSLFPTQTTA